MTIQITNSLLCVCVCVCVCVSSPSLHGKQRSGFFFFFKYCCKFFVFSLSALNCNTKSTDGLARPNAKCMRLVCCSGSDALAKAATLYARQDRRRCDER